MRHLGSLPLSTKLMAVFLLIALIPLGVLGFLNNRALRSTLTENANQALLAAATETATAIDAFINANLQAVRIEAQLPALAEYLLLAPAQRPGSPQETEVNAILRALSLKDQVNILSYALLDQQGQNLVDTYTPDIGLDESDRDYFRIWAQSGVPYVSPVQFSPTSGDASFYLSSPVRNAAGELIGALRVRYNAAVLQQFVRQTRGLAGESSFAILFDEYAIRLAHATQPDLIFKAVVPLPPEQITQLQSEQRLPPGSPDTLATNLPDFAQGLQNAQEHPFFTAEVGENGDSAALAVRPLLTRPWLLVFAKPHSAFLAPIDTQTRETLFLSILIAIAVAIAAIATTRAVTGPITRLTAVAERVRAGDLAARAQPETRDEIGQLAEAFNAMTNQLQAILFGLEQRVVERTSALAQRVDQLSLINRVGRKATAVLDLPSLLPHVAALIRTGFSYDAVLIFLTDPVGNTLHLSTMALPDEAPHPSDQLEIAVKGDSIIGHAAEHGEAVMVNDVTHDPRYQPHGQLPPAQAELALPLRVGQRVLGVIDLRSMTPNAFTEESVQVLQTLADQIAVAIQNAELFHTAQAARTEAEEANRIKSTFLANISHELRTPLNSIINFTGFVLDEVFGTINEEQRQFLSRTLRSAEHLLGLINDILDLSKIDAGKMELFFEQLYLDEMFLGVMNIAEGLKKDKNIELRLELPENLPPVWADPTRVQQVLLNLVSNAIKFTETGHVTIRARADQEWVTLSVEDSGIGIAADDVPKVFAEFTQVDGSLTRRAGGTGLGVPISKRFVELHGGNMWVESQPNVGSRFFFTLPRHTLPPPPVETNIHTGAKVLVIDHDPLVQTVIERQLTNGYQVSTLTEPDAALKHINHQRPDVMVVDLLTPSKATTWKLLQTLKEHPETQDIPVVVCGILRETNTALPLNIGGYLLKPIVLPTLTRVAAQFVPPNGPILVMEPDPTTLTTLSHFLTTLNYRVSTAQDGWAGLVAARAQSPRLILLDLLLTGLGGLEVLAQLRTNPLTANIPIVAMVPQELSPAETAHLQAQASQLQSSGKFDPREFEQALRRVIPYELEE